MVAQEDRPLAVVGDLRGLADDVGDRVPVGLRQRHVHPRHQREVEAHVALVALAEVGAGVLGPLVGLGEQHAVGVVPVELGADRLQDVVGLGQVLVVGSLALDEVGDGVEPQAVDAHVEPHPHDLEHFLEHAGVVEVEVGLVGVEAVPVEGVGDRVPGPVRDFSVSRKMIRVSGYFWSVSDQTYMSRAAEPGRARRAFWNHGCWSEVWLMTSSVMTRRPRRCASATKALKSFMRAVGRVDRAVVGDVVAVVAQRRGVERHQPDRGDARAPGRSRAAASARRSRRCRRRSCPGTP